MFLKSVIQNKNNIYVVFLLPCIVIAKGLITTQQHQFLQYTTVHQKWLKKKYYMWNHHGNARKVCARFCSAFATQTPPNFNCWLLTTAWRTWGTAVANDRWRCFCSDHLLFKTLCEVYPTWSTSIVATIQVKSTVFITIFFTVLAMIIAVCSTSFTMVGHHVNSIVSTYSVTFQARIQNIVFHKFRWKDFLLMPHSITFSITFTWWQPCGNYYIRCFSINFCRYDSLIIPVRYYSTPLTMLISNSRVLVASFHGLFRLRYLFYSSSITPELQYTSFITVIGFLTMWQYTCTLYKWSETKVNIHLTTTFVLWTVCTMDYL